MRSNGFVLWVTLVLSAVCLSFCKNQNSDISRSGVKPGTYTYNREQILSWADSVNRMLPFIQKQHSLIYELQGTSFYVSKYTRDDSALLYVEHVMQAESQVAEKRYYMRRGQLCLYTEVCINRDRPDTTTEKALYFNNNKLEHAERWLTDNVKAGTESLVKAIKPDRKDQFNDLQRFEDALKQRGEFDLAFQGITTSPHASYLILSRNSIKAYRAVLKINSSDDLIRDLSSNPSKYTGSKLDVDYMITEAKNAVYITGRIKRN